MPKLPPAKRLLDCSTSGDSGSGAFVADDFFAGIGKHTGIANCVERGGVVNVASFLSPKQRTEAEPKHTATQSRLGEKQYISDVQAKNSKKTIKTY